jgi:serine/threonine-protein kinase RsbW
MSAFHHELAINNDISCLFQVRELVSRSVKEGGFPTQVTNRLQIAVDEAVTNIIEHGYAGQPRGSGTIWMTFDVSPEAFRIEILDNGHSFDPRSKSDVDIHRHAAEGKSGGLGVFLMRKIMDIVEYRSESGRNNRLLLVKNRS